MFIIIIILLVTCAFPPPGWTLQVDNCPCHQPIELAPHRHPRHLHHQKPTRRHRMRGHRLHTGEFTPRIIEHPADLVVRRDQPVTMKCRAEGNPDPTIEWYRNGEYLNFSKSHGSLFPDGSLFFYQIKGKSDEGVYTCLARNRLGVALSKNASLTIAVLREDFRQEPSDKGVAMGKQLVIECSPPRGHPEPVVTWKKDGYPLDQNNSHYTFAAGKLSIPRALRTDSGVYICVASNQAGERTSRAAQISVLEPPQFTIKPVDAVAKSGSPVQFRCGAQGIPRPVVQWSKEEGALPTGRYAVTNENTLSLQRVTVQDSGVYRCTAKNQVDTVFVSAQLVVEDPLDTGQRDRQKEIIEELYNVRVYLDVVALQNSSSVRVQWRVSSASQYTEGYAVFYRPHPPANSDWVKSRTVLASENSLVFTDLHRGQRYEFKVRPYGRTVYGADSNIKYIQVPDTVPGHPPQNVTISMAGGRNGSVIVSWGPPTPDENIKAYKVWCFQNETHYEANWTVDARTRSLEIPMLSPGVRYQVQVAPIYDGGMGKRSSPKYLFIEPPDLAEETHGEEIPLDLILQVMKHPAFIATVGGAIWVMLMVAVVYLCQRHSKRYSSKKHSGLYRFASEDTIIKHRMDTSDSPWLSNTWKSASCSRNYSSTTSMNSQLLWMENKDTGDFHKSTLSFERKSNSSLNKIISLVPDSGNMYGALYVDLPGKDLTTFQRPTPAKLPGMGVSAKCPIPLGLYDHRPFLQCLNHGSASNLTQGGARTKMSQKPVAPGLPNVALKEPWSLNCKRELHHVNSAPLSPYFQTSEQGSSVPSVKSLAGNQPRRGENAKVMKTFSSPKILHYTTSLKVMDLLPYNPSLPPPPIPPPNEDSFLDLPNKAVSDTPSYSDLHEEHGHKQSHSSERKTPPNTLMLNRAASASMSVADDNVLTPDDVAQYLELSERGDNTRHPSESDSTLPRAFSSNTYGYIYSPSETVEEDPADEDDDLDLGDVSSLKSYRKYCETPTSSISDYESSMAGSLINGWGSVSEDNYTSARCSMVSSSDGSFLMDANFAKALAVAVDSFCLGLQPPESVGADRLYTDLSPSASPLDGLLAAQNPGENVDLNSRRPKVTPLPVLDWNIDWMDELEAKYSQRSHTKNLYSLNKKVESFK